jgi:hydroxyethylthiazole kinase-like uncharacterized protein yjeF
MRPGVWPLVGAATMRALDRHTIETLGVPGELLMESAGRAVAEAVLRLRAGGAGGDVLLVCGTGNNGGDGLVAARHLALLGVPVRVAVVGDAGRMARDAAANRDRLRRLGVGLESGRLRTAGAGVIVDALFGTGLARAVEGAPAEAIRRILASRPAARVVSVDLPSGLDADTGQTHGVAIQADVTVTIALPKLGLALEPGRSLAGRIEVARIGIADAAPGVAPDAELWTARAVGARLPARPHGGHKGSFGHVLVVAGSRGKTGAATLAAEGALRAGAGLVTIACPAGVNEILEVKCTEAMTAPVADTAEGGFSGGAVEAVLRLASERDVVALGPGVGREEETQKLVRELAARVDRPLVLDADGLYAFSAEAAGGRRTGAGRLSALKARNAATILTPHPGEAARLLDGLRLDGLQLESLRTERLGAKGGARARARSARRAGSRSKEIAAGDLNRDRIGAARLLVAATGAVVVLKGAATVVAAPDGRVVVNPTGGPVLGSGGTGDVLTGVVAGLLGQGMEAFEAAVAAVWVHGEAGDRLASERGAAGTIAGEVAAGIPAVLAGLRRVDPAGSQAGAGCAALAETEATGLAPSFP